MDRFLNDRRSGLRQGLRHSKSIISPTKHYDKSVAIYSNFPRRSQSSMCVSAFACCHSQGPRGRWDPGDLKGIRIDKAGAVIFFFYNGNIPVFVETITFFICGPIYYWIYSGNTSIIGCLSWSHQSYPTWRPPPRMRATRARARPH